MGKKSKYSKELKVKACKDYDKGTGSFGDIAEKIGTSKQVVHMWYLKYKVHGPSALETLSKNRSYSKVFKLTVVEEYTTGKYSLTDLSAKYNIAAAMVFNWVNKWYDGIAVSYTHLRAHETRHDIVCRLLL